MEIPEKYPIEIDGKEMLFDLREISNISNACVYLIIRKPGLNSSPEIVFINETEDIVEEIRNHYKKPCFRKYRAEHVVIIPEKDNDCRKEIKKKLLSIYNPICNDENI